MCCSGSSLVDILLAPTLSMIPLGGFLDVGRRRVCGGSSRRSGRSCSATSGPAVRWYVAYLVVFLGSGIAGELLGGVSPPLPGWFTSTMLALNVAVGGTIVFTLLALFAQQRARCARRAAERAGARPRTCC